MTTAKTRRLAFPRCRRRRYSALLYNERELRIPQSTYESSAAFPTYDESCLWLMKSIHLRQGSYGSYVFIGVS